MTFNEFRNYYRRQDERRELERRTLSLAFMSPEWLDRIQKENLMWPKSDRRVNDRRDQLRRQKSRRTKKNKRVNRATSQTNQTELLTTEEKQFLNQLIQDNFQE